MNKRYEYDGLIYCEDDLSEEIDNYGGDLYELFVALECDDRVERKVMYCSIDVFDGESIRYKTNLRRIPECIYTVVKINIGNMTK